MTSCSTAEVVYASAVDSLLVSSLLTTSALGVSTGLGVVNFTWRGCPFR